MQQTPNPRRRIIVVAVSLVFVILGVLASYFFVGRQAEAPTENVRNAAPARLFPKKGTQKAQPNAKVEDLDIEATFEEIEKIRTATDAWAGMNYQLRLYIKQLDENRDRLTPEQLERLHMYQQETPDWEDIDQ